MSKGENQGLESDNEGDKEEVLAGAAGVVANDWMPLLLELLLGLDERGEFKDSEEDAS